jgi:hypothetical protein
MRPEPPLKSPPRRSGGMVLLELIVALTVFALVAFALVGALDAGMTVAGERDQIDAATRGLANQLALLHVGRIDPGSRDVRAASDGIAYHLTIEPALLRDQHHELLSGLYRATVVASWKTGGREEDRSVSELIYQP